MSYELNERLEIQIQEDLKQDAVKQADEEGFAKIGSYIRELMRRDLNGWK